MHEHPNIFLIGMPGAGKSTVGRALAKSLAMTFVDSDDEIIRRNGVEIATIFEIEGEAGFRQREALVIDELTQRAGIVLATGGGAVLRLDNREALARRGVVVYLHTTLDVLVQRTTQDIGKRNKRPLLDSEDVSGKLTELLAVRAPLYREIADIIVDTTVSGRNAFLPELAAEVAAFAAKWQEPSNPKPG